VTISPAGSYVPITTPVAAGEGVEVEDVVVANDRPVPAVACEIMAWLGWL
jgi:hypothetical protein